MHSLLNFPFNVKFIVIFILDNSFARIYPFESVFMELYLILFCNQLDSFLLYIEFYLIY